MTKKILILSLISCFFLTSCIESFIGVTDDTTTETTDTDTNDTDTDTDDTDTDDDSDTDTDDDDDSDDTDDSDDDSAFSISSIAVEDDELLENYQCEEKVNDSEASIPLAWENVPTAAESLAIVMIHYPNSEDLDNPNCYLVLWGIDPDDVSSIAHGEADDGDFYMGSDKDGVAISYTSPCSPSSGSHEYTLMIYALSETPSSLPTASSLDVTYDVLMDAIDTVTIVATASITFDSVTE